MKKYSYLLLLVLCVFVISCSDDNNEIPANADTISISDPNTITSNITIEGSSIVSGNPPAPSTDANAPSLYESDGDVVGITGNSLLLSIDQETSNSVGGVYLKVVGADSYFDIPASALASSGGRIAIGGRKDAGRKSDRTEKTEEDVSVGIEIPEGLEPGVFCVEYCIYDTDNLVSNIVEVCIEVKEFGGAGSEFLIKQWEAVKISGSETEEGQTETWEEIIGEPQSESNTEEFWCETTQSYATFTYEEISREDYIYFEFTNNGAMSIDEKYYNKELRNTNACSVADIQYSENNDMESVMGAWAYDATSSKLTLVLKDEYEECDYDDQGNETCETISGTYAIEYELIMQGNNIVLIFEENEGGDYSYKSEIEFKPRN